MAADTLSTALRMPSRISSIIGLTHDPNEIKNLPTHRATPDFRKHPRQFQSFRGAYESHDRPFRSGLRLIGVVARVLEAVEEKCDRDAEGLGDRIELGGANAIGATLVFLNLLEGQAKSVSQLILTKADQLAPQSHPTADMYIDGVRGLDL
jgi:hypothetical protein